MSTCAQSVSRLKAIDRAGARRRPTSSNYDLYLEMLETRRRRASTSATTRCPIRGVIPHNLLMPINQLEGVQQDIPRTIALMPAATVADYEDIVTRLNGVRRRSSTQTIALMKQGLAQA